MGLLRLLSLGRSMPQVRQMGQYNLPRRRALPTFGPRKAAEQRFAAKKTEAQAVPVQMAGKSEAVPVVEPKTDVAMPGAKPAGKWWQRNNPFASPASAPQPTPRQGELSLDKVTVVRSDLSDADQEVAPRKPKAPPGSTIPDKRYVRPESHPDKLGKKAWSLLGSRLFGRAAAKQH